MAGVARNTGDMSGYALAIIQWPEVPLLAPPRHPVLVRVSVSRDRSAARAELRSVLRTVLSAWLHLPPERLPLTETARGPTWQGELEGHLLDMSFSYTAGQGWIGLVRGARIGIDALDLAAVSDPDAIAGHYFSPAVSANVNRALDRVEAFAEAWTGLEAQLKCRGLGLVEWSPARDRELGGCGVQFQVHGAGTAVAVALSR